MKLHIAGSTLPNIDDVIIAGKPSARPPVQAITSAGASPMRSPRKSADVVLRCCCAFAASPPLSMDPMYTPSSWL